MAEPTHLSTTRESYDTVAETYAECIPARFAEEPLGRAMLAAFAELVRAAGGGLVADVGCGPGHVTAHLNSLGLTAYGIDLSPRMVDVARRSHPSLRFEVGSMTGLDIDDGALAGLVAWWSIIHTPPDVLPSVFAEFWRVLTAGGQLVVGFHVGDDVLRPEVGYGHPVSYSAYLYRPEHVTEVLERAGLPVTATQISEGAKRPQACLLAHRR